MRITLSIIERALFFNSPVRNVLIIITLAIAVSGCNGTIPGEEHPYIRPEDPAVSSKLEEWQDWKFGVIIHWGPYSQWGVVESWSLCPEDEPWCVRRGPYSHDYYLYTREYEKLPETFNPTGFDPGRWAEACSKAGMKYVVFTTKHHDGFAMFDTKQSDYRITGPGSAFAKDPRSNITGEVFREFRSRGMGIGAYFSKPDWHNDDYWWPYFPVFDRNVNYNPEKYPDRWSRFKQFTYNQIEELMTGYGSIDILWLDGGWVRPEGTLTDESRPWLGKNQWVQDVDIPSIASMARSHQPGLLVVDRSVHNEYENYRTPEQQVPEVMPDYPWESCITLGDSWYSTGPGETYKSATWAIHTLIKIVAKGGNFLLGIGPDHSGEMVPEVYERLEAIGNWMNVNSHAIYGTRPLAPYQEGKLCYTQSNDGTARHALMLIDEGEALPSVVELPAHFIMGGTEVAIAGYTETLSIQIRKGAGAVMLPEDLRQAADNTPALVFSVTGGRQ
jgi:alpha-L-fucosidase